MNETEYPYGPIFQGKVVAGILREPTFLLNYAALIRSEYFDSEVYQLLVRLVIDNFEENSEPPSAEKIQMLVVDYCRSLNLEDSFREKVLSVLESAYKLDLTDFKDVAERVVEFGKTRQMEELTKTLANALSRGEKVDTLWETIDRYRLKGSMDIQCGTELRVELLRLEEMIANDPLYKPELKVKTGIPSLDAAFFGGLGRREVGIAMAFTGFGKSTLLINFGASAAFQGAHVLHATIGELEENDLVLRYAARLTETPISEIISDPAAFTPKLNDILEQYAPEVVIEYFPAGTKVATLRSWVSRCKFRLGLDPAVLLIDNASDLASAKQRYASNEYEEHGNVYTELKGLAHDFNLAIWTDSQTNRMGIKADLSDLDVIADSMRKAHKADVVLSINQTADEAREVPAIARLFLAKARRYDKSNPVIRCQVDRECYLIKEAP